MKKREIIKKEKEEIKRKEKIIEIALSTEYPIALIYRDSEILEELESWEFKCEICYDTVNALNRLSEKEFSLILVDLSYIRDLSKFIKSARKVKFNIPIIIISPYRSPDCYFKDIPLIIWMSSLSISTSVADAVASLLVKTESIKLYE